MQLSLWQRGRIRLARARRWEFWPAWLFYIPVVLWIVLLGLRHRHFTLFTAANPGMDDGGVVGERKSPLLLALRDALPEATPRLQRLPASLGAAERLEQARDFINGQFPVVLKPEIGQRGRGVLIARDAAQVERYLAASHEDLILQDFVPGKEFGIFVYRDPDAGDIRIYSVTAKELMHVHGDGQRPLHRLIMEHPRAWLTAPMLFERHRSQLAQVVPAGEDFHLVDVGSHCRGAVFLDGHRLITPALGQRMAAIVESLPGFHFGRLDVIAPDRKALREARDIQVLEINGVTSEAAHVYHPGTPLLNGYRSFFRQWQLAFAIGHRNRQAGAATVSPWRLLRLFLSDLKRYEAAESASAGARQA